MSIAAKPVSQSISHAGYPPASTAFHWIVTAIGLWTVSGVYIDGWAHSHGQVDNTFFTIWHANLYTGILAMLAFTGINQLLNMRRGYNIFRALPEGYLLTLIGAGLFMAGGGFDFMWHSIFGFEVDFELLMSPAHLWLAISIVLMLAGIAQSAWNRLAPNVARGWKALGPLIISTMLILSVAIFFTMYTHPVNEVHAGEGDQASQPTVSASQYIDLYEVNVETGKEMRLTASDAAFASFGAYSTDGSQIIYTQGPIAGEESDGHQSSLWVMDADGSNAHMLFDLPGEEIMQAVSPDGKRVAFVHIEGEEFTLTVSDLDGGNLVELAPGGFGAAWSPDGQFIAYSSQLQDSEDNQIFIVRPDGSDLKQLTHTTEDYKYAPDWSPDGKQVAYTLGDNVLGETIVAVDVDTLTQTRLTEAEGFEAEPVWSPDGKQVLYRHFDGDVSNVWVMDAGGGNAHPLTANHTLFLYALHWSADGKSVLYTGQPLETGGGQSDYDLKSLSVAGILLQSILLMAALAVLTYRWNLPFGAMTLVVGVTTAGITIMDDTFQFIPMGFVAGLLTDVLYAALGKPITGPGKRALFAFLVPVIYYALYFVTIQFTQGVAWTVAVWAGAIVLAGLAGYLVSFVAQFLTPSSRVGT